MEGLFAKKIFDFSLLRRIFSFSTPYKKQLLAAIMMAIGLALIAVFRPLLIQLTVDKYIFNGWVTMLIDITLFQIGILIIETLMRFYFSFITSWLGQTIIREMRIMVYNKIIRLNLNFFDKTPIGTLTTRTINDIEAINNVFSDGFLSIVADMLTIVSVILVMLYKDWRLTLVSLSVFPILIFATYIFKEAVNKSFFRVRNAVAALNAFAQEHITGMFVVQAFAAEKKELGKFKVINRDHRSANIDAIFAYSLFFPIVEIISALSIGLLVWYGSVEIIHLHSSYGMIVAFYLFINILFRPLRTLADKFNVLQMGMVASERVFKVLDNEDTMPNPGVYSPAKLSGRIEFEKVWFAYKTPHFVLKDISFQVNPGETLAIVGHTGSGKSTLVSLLNRLYEIQQGIIRIDGRDIREFHLDSLRASVGVVLQDVFLFSGTIYENITLRNPKIGRKAVEHAAQLIGMHDFIVQLPGGYDYNVMERGNTLSMGQRQLISFIRALLYDPSILILDEATSSVDTESEMLIQQAIEKLITGRTSIVIAHRLSTISKANKILVLDQGEIKEAGTHEELLQLEGFYYNLHQMQFADPTEKV
ncbi:MAG: ABC transporter ATP-binding protein [Chitinophagaceae bacterium]